MTSYLVPCKQCITHAFQGFPQIEVQKFDFIYEIRIISTKITPKIHAGVKNDDVKNHVFLAKMVPLSKPNNILDRKKQNKMKTDWSYPNHRAAD